MRRFNYHNFLIIAAILCAANSFGQTKIVDQKVVLPLSEPTGSGYGKNNMNFYMGYANPQGNTKQEQLLFWNSGGIELRMASTRAINKRIGLGYQLGYSYLKYGVRTNDSLGTGFVSDKAIVFTNLLEIDGFIRLFLGRTYFQPSIDFGGGYSFSNKTKFIHHGTYLVDNIDATMKFAKKSSNQNNLKIFGRINLKKFYVGGIYYTNPLFIRSNNNFEWQTHLVAGLRF